MKERLLALGSSLLLALSFPAAHAGIAATSSYEDTAYIRVITERAGKIVATLGLPDSATYLRVRGLVANQYKDLNAVYTDRDDRLRQLKDQQPAPDKATADSLKRNIQQDVDARVEKLHTAYLAHLRKELTPQQVDEVKDGMTYSVLEVTYKAYQDMLPSLTGEQKKKILSDLTEAREHAMDAESSKKKHEWFGKYKGRINNYLSSQGIDMKQAEKEWAERRGK